MVKIPNPNPNTLAEKVAAVGSTCPIPATHDRLFEMHHWWHELARWYHEPEPFRYRLGAFIQSARSVTFMLQSEKSAFQDFTWYGEWVARAKDDPALLWLNGARTDFVHRQALEPNSWLEVRCLGNPRVSHGTDDEPLKVRANPFQCTHYYMHGPGTDHAHEYTRHWGMDSLPDRELLAVGADVYDRLDDIVRQAHERTGAKMVSHAQEASHRRLPCMEDTMRFRVVRTRVFRGQEVWIDEPDGLHEHEPPNPALQPTSRGRRRGAGRKRPGASRG